TTGPQAQQRKVNPRPAEEGRDRCRGSPGLPPKCDTPDRAVPAPPPPPLVFSTLPPAPEWIPWINPCSSFPSFHLPAQSPFSPLDKYLCIFAVPFCRLFVLFSLFHARRIMRDSRFTPL